MADGSRNDPARIPGVAAARALHSAPRTRRLLRGRLRRAQRSAAGHTRPRRARRTRPLRTLLMAQPHVVIVGAGFGGLTAARALARADVDVTLIDRSNHHLFQPLLYQVATAGLSPADIAAPI